MLGQLGEQYENSGKLCSYVVLSALDKKKQPPIVKDSTESDEISLDLR